MAKRGRKPTSGSNSKGRPRTRSQIKPSEASDSPSQSPVKKSTEKKPKTLKSGNKKTKSTTAENIVEKVSPTKVTKAKTEKVKNEPKKASKKSKKDTTDQSEKPAKPAVKRPRKSKAKNAILSEDEKISEFNVSKVSKTSKPDNDDTEEEEIFAANMQMQQQLLEESANQSFYDASSYVPSRPVHQAPTPHLTPLLPSGSFHAHASSTKAPFQFESSLEKLQQETMAPKPFNVNNQEAHYLSPLYPSATLTSSSTSAFSAPVPPKHYQTPVTHSETNLPNMLSPSPMPPVSMSHQSPIAPNHQNLLSPPQGTNPADPVHDLPPELLQQGWRKFWSKRENRPYFFNKVTNESLWEMPKLSTTSGHYDPVTDPLGIQASNSGSNSTIFQPPTPTDPGTPPIYPPFNPAMTPFGQTRNHDQAMTNGKKTLIGPFDFDIDSNCFIWEGLVFYYFHAHPETELLRCTFINKLRQQYYELCHTRESIEPPKDSFTRWILERKITDKGCDPFLPSDCPVELSKTLFNEIMNDIPIKQIKPKFGGEARKQLSKYAEAAKKIIDSPHVSAISRKIVKWNVEDAFEWIRKTLNATFEDYIERLEHLKKQCQPHIIDAARSSVEAICLKIYHVSVDYSKRIREQNLEIFKKDDLRERAPMRLPNQKKVICYPAYLINPCPKLPAVQMFTEKDGIVLRYKNGELLRMNTVFLQKLEILYFYNSRDDRKYSYFLTRVWCMIKRYQTFFNKTEGITSQHSLPLSVFSSLNKHFGVTFECFASPLNCYFRQYCSIFPDTDSYFGSRGSILNFYPMSGSFQANPPDCEELIEATVSHFDKLLENSVEPLSFILFIQEVPESTQKVIPKLESNKFKRTHLSIAALDHEYRHGFQYMCNPSEVVVSAQYNTLVYFLQNDAGFLKWGPTPERVEDLVESFKLGQDKELPMLSPPATPVNNQKPETEVRPNGNESKDLIQ